MQLEKSLRILLDTAQSYYDLLDDLYEDVEQLNGSDLLLHIHDHYSNFMKFVNSLSQYVVLFDIDEYSEKSKEILLELNVLKSKLEVLLDNVDYSVIEDDKLEELFQLNTFLNYMESLPKI